ncbi:Acetyltransferase Pat [Poriferisphaera corsica]|uniref:Acetyltransferase Pat n=1 Tax=Poriferisphaera corsica TaxID=2528020 RepID=A0A517YUN9_9BACT|nr:GNAT family N-acetyltransferase [Poriferisphaera corsica]QDU33882.1 Acetyltransferase Pat [Poriferisphaera corsica]
MHAYEAAYRREVDLKSGERVLLRVIRLDDEERMVQFHEGLSALTVRRRYFDTMSLAARTKHERLMKICEPRLERECAIVVVSLDPNDREQEIVGVGRLEDQVGLDVAEFAVLILDAWQGKGLGRLLMEELVEIAKQHGLRGIEAEILLGNMRMRKLLKGMGFTLRDDLEEGAMFAEKRFD